MTYSPPNAFRTAFVAPVVSRRRKRAAIYLDLGRTADGLGQDDLLTTTRYAKSANLRVVAISQEELGADRESVARSRMADLLARMADGEFEMIVAVGGDGKLVTICV